MAGARALLVLLPLALAGTGTTQGTRADYARAATVARMRDLVVRFAPDFHWLPDGAGIAWREGGRDGVPLRFVRVDAASGERREAATAAGLGLEIEFRAATPLPADARSRDGGAETSITLRNGFERALRVFGIDRRGRAHAYGELPPHGSRQQHSFAGHVWRLEFDDGEVAGVFAAGMGEAEFVADEASRRVAASPDGPRRDTARQVPAPPGEVFVEDHDLHYRAPDGAVLRLTADGNAAEPYERPRAWSPDGAHALCFRVVPSDAREITLVESAPRDQLQPRVHRIEYAKPGDRIAVRRPVLLDLERRCAVPVDAAAFPNPWSLAALRWAADGGEVFVLYIARGHQRVGVYAIDAETGAVRSVVEERSDTFVDDTQKTWMHWVDGGAGLLWASERDGWNHLWHVDVATGVLAQVTRGDWLVRRVERVDEVARQIWFTAFGIHPGQDPYHAHLARIGFDGTGLTVLTEADGTHEWTFAPDGSLFVDRWSRVDHPWVTELRRARDGALVAELGRDDVTALLATGWRFPERFVAKGRDDQTDIHGILIRPSTFDADGRYPIVESIYAGPHDFHVPKAFGAGARERAIAELGFVVVQIDGMGTNWRHKAFHDVCWRNLKDSGFPDRIRWMRAAAAVHPELDIARVGVFGGSAGGQSALAALLHHGDFYDAAAADCGCHDNRMDKIWWNEAWMGWPVGPHYADNSNTTHAAKLQGHLLLTVGELDRNVDPASTLQVVDALIRADKDFEFVLVPGGGHGVGESAYLARRRMDFFVRHLLGVEPRRE